MDMAVMSGALRLPGFDIDPDRYYESKWIAPAAQFVDPQKEAEALSHWCAAASTLCKLFPCTVVTLRANASTAA